ncbi:hypothetical protein BCR35DRAFT_298044 [Leucosporidium creatinivorum]|uniref:Uncharacterized protein n=1 Tax=Leucosporidium creatinivorum TaxID=106004 RepID=A0A1Y2G3S0_9BASI|nr:hypothetical protein BCR35DRAFT_298044 [Leucosporidium creatinivorum]
MASFSSSSRASTESKLVRLVLALLFVAQLAVAATPTLPQPSTLPRTTPSVIPPPRPRIGAYPGFDKLLQPGWRANGNIAHVLDLLNILNLADKQRGILSGVLPLPLPNLLPGILQRRAGPPGSPKPTTPVKVSSTTTKASSTTKSSSSTLSSSSSARATTTSVVGTSTTIASSTSAAPSASATVPCIGGSANASYISSLFAYGGIGYTVELCPSANIALEQAVYIWFANQTLTTRGNPTDATRATLTVTNPNITCALFTSLDNVNGISIQNIQVDGARPSLGIVYGGLALIEMGGNTLGQTIKNVHAFEPRGWSVLHLAEGYGNACSSAQILNNQIGPSGHAPSGAQQFKRDSTGTYTPGQWADGISLACKGSTVQGNTVTDTTDGGIVIFGAPGSQVTGNTIIANDRQALGGINMVDWNPFSGSFLGTVVSGNNIIAQASLLKVGIAVGGMTWGTDNRTEVRTFGGQITNNIFSSGPTGYFGYSIAVSGHENVTITGNTATAATYGGVESSSCFTYWFPLPTPQPFIADPYTTPGVILQSDFLRNTPLVLVVCRGPKP